MDLRRMWPAVTVLGAAICSFAHAEDPPAAAPDVASRVDAYLKGLADAGLFSGTVLVARGGKILVESAYGKADIASNVPNKTTTQFKLMSVSKSITAVAVMRLVQDGRLGLEDPVAQRLPSWPAAWRGVTVHQLLDHTSGIANIENEWTAAAIQAQTRGLAVWRAFAPHLADRPLASAPGTRPAYSNFNFVLLGLVIEAVSGKSYPDMMKSSVLDPAGMTKTGFDDGTRRPGLSIGYFRDKEGEPDPSVQDMSTIQAAGGIYSTVGDLHRLDRALRGESLLSADTKLKMETPTAASPMYACGWQLQPVLGRKCVHHSGGANGYVADFLRFPEEDACVAVQSNFAFAPIGRISDDLAALLFGVERPTAKKVARPVLDACTGMYRVGGRTLLVRRSGSSLLLFDVGRIASERVAAWALLPIADDIYVMPYGEDKLRFDKPVDGHIPGLRLEYASGVLAMARIPPPREAWRAAAGDYRTESLVPKTFQIVDSAGGLQLKAPDGWPRDHEIVPLTETLAIALYNAEGGTLLHLVADEKGRARGLRWQRNDGQTVEATRAAK